MTELLDHGVEHLDIVVEAERAHQIVVAIIIEHEVADRDLGELEGIGVDPVEQREAALGEQGTELPIGGGASLVDLDPVASDLLPEHLGIDGGLGE